MEARHVVVRDDEPAGGPAVLGEDGGDPVEDAAADVDVVGGIEPPVEIHPDPVHDGTLSIRCMAVSSHRQVFHELVELLGLQGLHPVGDGLFGLGVDLDDDPVGPHGDGRAGERRHVLPVARRMARVHDHREVGELLEDDDGREIQGVSRGRLEGADPPLAEDDLAVALREDVLGRHEELLDRRHHPPLEQDGLASLAHFFQQGEILDVARADLEDVGIGLDEIHVGGIYDLRHDGKPRALADLLQELEALLFEALEAVGRGAGLEGAAPEDMGAGLLRHVGALHELLLRLDGAGPRHDDEPRPADLDLAHADDRVGFPEFAARQLVGLENGNDDLHPRQVGDGLDLLAAAGIPHGADDRLLRPAGQMGPVPDRLDPLDDPVDLSVRCAFFHHDDHNCSTSNEKGHDGCCPHGPPR